MGWLEQKPKTVRSRRTLALPEIAVLALQRRQSRQAEERLAAAEAWSQEFGDLVFRQSVPRSVRLAEAPSHGLPAIAYDRRSAGADAYWKVAMELVERA